MTVYITKYALSRGIFEAEATPGPYDGCVTIGKNMYNSGEWAATPQEARLKSEQKRKDKIRSLEKSLNKVKYMNFATIRDYKELRI